MKRCELCGTPVKVVGHTTKHYEPIEKVSLDGIVDVLNKFHWSDLSTISGTIKIGKAIADYVNGGGEHEI